MVDGGSVASRVPRWLQRTGVHLGVIALFTLPAVFLWWNAWSGGPASTIRCGCFDPGQQAWFVAWPAYALAHGLDPLSTTWLWMPHGVNLLNNASAPLAGLALAPVTWLFGPFVATTVGLTLAPGLSAWGCWIACRRFVAWPVAWWVGGFLFGYSPFIVDSVGQGHLDTALLVLPPLMLVVLHEMLVRQQRSVWWCGLSLGVLVFAQYLISAEVLTMVVPVAAVGIAAAAALSPRRAVAAFPFAIRAAGVAVLVAVVLLIGPALYMLTGPQHIHGSVWSGLHDFLVAALWEVWSKGPTSSVLWPGALQGPQVQFLGYGILIVGAACLALAWRRRSMWVMAVTALAATVFSWGGILWLSPNHFVISGWLPWKWVTDRPVFDDISAIHFSVLADLAVAIVIAIGLDALHLARPWRRLPTAARAGAIGGAALLMLVPVWQTYGAPLSVTGIDLPPWYATVGTRVPEGSVVTSYPWPASAAASSAPMVWQAADGMRFRLSGGYVKVPGPTTGVIGTGRPGSAVRTLVDLTVNVPGQPFPLSARQLVHLRSALATWKTAYIVVSDRGNVPTEAAAVFTAATGRLPTVAHRAWVWNLRARPLQAPYDAATASRRFTTCRAAAANLGEVTPDQPLSQLLNRCVLSGSVHA